MQNKMKRIAMLLLAVVMLVASCSVAFAAESAAKSPEAISLSGATIRVGKLSATYNGSKQTASVTVRLNGKKLAQGTDYVVYGNKTIRACAGQYDLAIKVVGVGKYKGTVTRNVTYTIKKAATTLKVSKSTIRVKYSTLQDQDVTKNVTLTTNPTGRSFVWKTKKGITVSKSGEITIPQGLKKGTYTIKVYAKASYNYKKSATKTITIKVV